MLLTQEQLDKIAEIVERETTAKGRKLVKMLKHSRKDGPYLWLQFTDGQKSSMRFRTESTRDVAFARFKEQFNDPNGAAG